MARPLNPASAADVTRVLDALEMLRAVRARLTAAECPAAVAKVASAIKSTEGALRHVQRRYREGLGFEPLIDADARATR